MDNSKFLIGILGAVVLILALVIVIPGFMDNNTNNEHTINVQGYAEREVSADEASFNIFIYHDSETANEAKSRVDLLWEEAKVKLDSKDYVDYETIDYGVREEYEWERDGGLDKNTQMYTAYHRIKVTVSNIDKLSDAIDNTITGNFMNIENISFAISKDREDEIKSELWAEAVEGAKKKAQDITEATGSRLIDTPKSITINEYNYRPYLYKTADSYLKGGSQIEQRDLTISVSLNLVYEYR